MEQHNNKMIVTDRESEAITSHTNGSTQPQTISRQPFKLEEEWTIFLTAIMFLTRIKVPANINHQPKYLEQSSRYFPLVGMIVAAIGVLVFLVVNKYISENLAILSYMLTTIWVTGAFHEDGFADVCDGFGGGWTKEKILTIMKDSRLGTFGVMGLIGIFSTKFLLLQELPKFTPATLTETLNPLLNYKIFILLMLAAHASSRLMAITVIQQYAYVTDPDQSKSKPLSKQPLGAFGWIVAITFTAIPFCFLPWQFLLVCIPMFIARTQLAQYFKQWIGGYTGDCLGTVQQITEIIFYISALIVWRYLL